MMKRKSDGLTPGKENIATPSRKRSRKGEEPNSQKRITDFFESPKTEEWMTRYKCYKANEAQGIEEVENVLNTDGMSQENEPYFLKIVKCFNELRFFRGVSAESILDSLKQHPLYNKATVCAKRRLQTLTTNEKDKASAVFCIIVFLSTCVRHIRKLVNRMKHAQNTSTNHKIEEVKILEALYCLATLLYRRRDNEFIGNNRLLYNICYYLNIREQKISHRSSRKETVICPTEEQQQIISHDLCDGDVVKVEAFAGTGKTRTLIEYANNWKDRKFLYVAFNRTTKTKAKRIFPKNVECMTFHSLANEEKGRRYKDFNKLNYNSLTLPVYKSASKYQDPSEYELQTMAKKTLETFFASDDEKIRIEHVPTDYTYGHGQQDKLSSALAIAKQRWKKMKSLKKMRGFTSKMTPDGYFKLWVLSNPVLSRYDAIFVDDAQDCTPAMINVILSQKCGKIFAGDPNQQIYNFRGANNALSKVPATHNFSLTQIFRFGPKIAYVAAAILDFANKRENAESVVGVNSTDGNIRNIRSSAKRDARGRLLEKTAILCRTNARVFDELVRVTEERRPKIRIIGGPKSFGLEKIHDIWRLYSNEGLMEIKDKRIKTWKQRGFQQLKEYAEKAADKELQWKIGIVEKYNRQIPELMDRIENCHTHSMSMTEYFIGTAYKAKGMQYDTVIVTDDYVNVPIEWGNTKKQQIPSADEEEDEMEPGPSATEKQADEMEPGPPTEKDLREQDEWNLLYVAVTSAKKNLVITKTIEKILSLKGEHFLKAELTSDALKEGPKRCAIKHCKNTLREDTILTMKRMPIIYSDGTEDKGGYLCYACAEERVGSLIDLTAPPEVLKSMQLNE
ncbi:F-box DNA helicase 1-like [Discoglossus pictus]